MLTAIISDIHSNLEALEACLKHIDRMDVGKIVCLGDVVGYGPNPKEVLEIVKKRCDVVLLGNHDEALLKQPVNFNKIPREAILWTKAQFNIDTDKEMLDYLWSLSPLEHDGELVYSHGMLHSNMNYVEEPEDVLFIFERMSLKERLCFAGHSHIPCIWALENNSLYYVEALENEPFELERYEKCWINVGSVGQPRDRDNRSCFATYDTKTQVLQYHRVAYDHATTASKIRQQEGLDDFLADRLHRGL